MADVTSNVYLSLATIQGDVTSSAPTNAASVSDGAPARWNGWIACQGFTLGTSNDVNGGEVGKPLMAGKTTLHSVSIAKFMDMSSPNIFAAIVSAQILTDAWLDVAINSNTLLTTYHFQNVIIADYHSSAGGHKPTENITFHYEKVTMTYVPTTQMSGLPSSGPIVSGFNALTGTLM